LVLDAQPARELCAVAVVTVEQLQDSGRLAGGPDSFFDTVTVNRIDEPDATVDDKRVRAAFHELVHDPAEAGVELVAELDFQRCHVAA
jgi:hypothetical protein